MKDMIEVLTLQNKEYQEMHKQTKNLDFDLEELKRTAQGIIDAEASVETKEKSKNEQSLNASQKD
jgi:hypothetical protein